MELLRSKLRLFANRNFASDSNCISQERSLKLLPGIIIASLYRLKFDRFTLVFKFILVIGLKTHALLVR